MNRNSGNCFASKYYKLSFCGGMEALSAKNHKTAFPFHYHPTYNITLVYNGNFNTKLHDRLVLAPSGSILITNPQEIHANPFEPTGTVSFFTFYVSQDFIAYCNEGQPVYFEQKTINDDGLFSQLHELSVKLSDTGESDTLENGFKSTLSMLAMKYGTAHVPEQNQSQLLFNDLLSGDNFEKFSLDDAAKKFGIDKFKFIRLFKYQTGLTPNNYFIYRRIEKSKLMLAEGKDLLSVAIDLGFYDTAHYCNHFKKFTGISPIAFTSGA